MKSKTDVCEMVQVEIKWRLMTSDLGLHIEFKIRSQSVMGKNEKFLS